MSEESLREEMRAALRGDRERAEQARLRSSENVRALVVGPQRDEPPSEPRAERPRGLLGRLFGR